MNERWWWWLSIIMFESIILRSHINNKHTRREDSFSVSFFNFFLESP